MSNVVDGCELRVPVTWRSLPTCVADARIGKFCPPLIVKPFASPGSSASGWSEPPSEIPSPALSWI